MYSFRIWDNKSLYNFNLQRLAVLIQRRLKSIQSWKWALHFDLISQIRNWCDSIYFFISYHSSAIFIIIVDVERHMLSLSWSHEKHLFALFTYFVCTHEHHTIISSAEFNSSNGTIPKFIENAFTIYFEPHDVLSDFRDWQITGRSMVIRTSATHRMA